MNPVQRTIPPAGLESTASFVAATSKRSAGQAVELALQVDMDGSCLQTEGQKRPHYIAAVKELTGEELHPHAFSDLLGRSVEETVHLLNGMMEQLPRVKEEALQAHERQQSIGAVVLGRMISSFYRPDQPILAMEHFSETARAIKEGAPAVVGLVTSAPEVRAKDFTSRADILTHFDDVTGIGSTCPDTGEVVSKQKPSPQGYHVSTRRLRLDARTARVAVEDSFPGVVSAKESGARTIYLHDQRVGPINSDAARLADVVLTDWRQVLQYLRDNSLCS